MFLSNVSIGHDSTIGSFTFAGHGVVVNGHCTIGDACFLGSGCQILPDILLHKKTLVSNGAVMMQSTMEEGMRYFGNPARAFRKAD